MRSGAVPGDRLDGGSRASGRRVARQSPAGSARARGRRDRSALPAGKEPDVTALFDLLLASHNRGKLVELRALLAGLPVELVSLATALPGRPQAPEDGETFVDNARAQARAA